MHGRNPRIHAMPGRHDVRPKPARKNVLNPFGHSEAVTKKMSNVILDIHTV